MEPLFLLKVAKALVEVAGFSYLGLGIVGLLAGAARDGNFVFQLFKIITSPVTKTVRWIAPRFIPDRHIPFLAFGLLIWLWLMLLIGVAYFTAHMRASA